VMQVVFGCFRLDGCRFFVCNGGIFCSHSNSLYYPCYIMPP
jgi:hypothetical protein